MKVRYHMRDTHHASEIRAALGEELCVKLETRIQRISLLLPSVLTGKSVRIGKIMLPRKSLPFAVLL